MDITGTSTNYACMYRRKNFSSMQCNIGRCYISQHWYLSKLCMRVSTKAFLRCAMQQWSLSYRYQHDNLSLFGCNCATVRANCKIYQLPNSKTDIRCTRRCAMNLSAGDQHDLRSMHLSSANVRCCIGERMTQACLLRRGMLGMSQGLCQAVASLADPGRG